MKFISYICCILILFQFIETKLNSDILFSDYDKEKFLSLFQLPGPIDSNPLVNIYFSIFGLNLLDPNHLKSFLEKHNKNQVCELTKQFINKENAKNIENLYYASSIQKIVGCQINSNELASLIEPEINSALSIQNLFKAAVTLENAGKPLPVAKFSKLLSEALAKDDSFLSSGFALQLAAKLSKNDITNYANKIPNLITQADEVDEKYLQYEGGLGVTAAIMKGVIQLSVAANKDTTIKNLEVIKFSNYFLNRLSVQTSKGAAELLEILKILSTNKYFIPVVVSRYSSNIISDKSNFVIKVSNVLGQSLNKEFTATLKIDDSNEVKMNPVQGDSSLYAVNLMETLKQKPGKYNAIISLKPTKIDKTLIISNDISFELVFQSKVSLDSIEISVGEKDQLSLKYEPVEYPTSLSKVLECDSNQKISIKFCVRDLIQSKDISTQQAFIQFVNEKTKEVINFVADQDRISKVYIKDINLAYKGKEFNYDSGVYNINLVAGDSLISNPINWNLGKIKLQFSQDPINDESYLNYLPKPEIKHQFREPEKRPPVVVSHTFTLLSVAPILILFVSWFKIGLNLSNFSFSLSALLFHSSLALIFILYTLFFINMNMFTTIKCLSGVLITAFLSGHYLLKNLANKSTDLSSKKTN